MRGTGLIGALVVGVLCGGAGPDAAGQTARETEVTQVGELGKRLVAFATRAESVGFTGVILAAKGGAVVAATGVGFADLEDRVPITPATWFEIASSSKQITAAAVMRLVQDKKLKLDDSIAVHLPGVPTDCKGITVRHLLQHTSGIPGTNSAGGGDDLGAVLPVFLDGGPKFTPGSHWEYWNQGYALLSEIIARAAKKSYTAYCHDALFVPAGMKSTGFTGDSAPPGAVVVIGRSERGARSALEHPYGSYGFQYRGMGGVVTTVWDLWRWDRALRADKILNRKSKEELFRPGLEDYALGWFVRKNAAGRRVQSHSGSVRGFLCELRRYPDDDGCLFVLGNSDGAPSSILADALEQMLFGDQEPPLPPRPLGDEVQQALLGKYQDGKGNVLEVVADGRVTRARLQWTPPDGPVSTAVLGLDTAGGVVMYEWTAATPMTVERVAAKPATGIKFFDLDFRRIE